MRPERRFVPSETYGWESPEGRTGWFVSTSTTIRGYTPLKGQDLWLEGPFGKHVDDIRTRQWAYFVRRIIQRGWHPRVGADLFDFPSSLTPGDAFAFGDASPWLANATGLVRHLGGLSPMAARWALPKVPTTTLGANSRGQTMDVVWEPTWEGAAVLYPTGREGDATNRVLERLGAKYQSMEKRHRGRDHARGVSTANIGEGAYRWQLTPPTPVRVGSAPESRLATGLERAARRNMVEGSGALPTIRNLDVVAAQYARLCLAVSTAVLHGLLPPQGGRLVISDPTGTAQVAWPVAHRLLKAVSDVFDLGQLADLAVAFTADPAPSGDSLVLDCDPNTPMWVIPRNGVVAARTVELPYVHGNLLETVDPIYPDGSRHVAPGVPAPFAPDQPASRKRAGKALEVLLQHVLGHSGFRKGQVEGALAALSPGDTFQLMPTGGGKTAIYTIAGLLRPHTTIIVSPLVALISDQERRFLADGIDRIAALRQRNEELNWEEQERIAELQSGRALFVWAAPERIVRGRFQQEFLREDDPGKSRARLGFAVLDEAHCASEWGHDYRPSYLFVRDTLERMKVTDGPLQVYACTGTASQRVVTDVVRDFHLRGEGGRPLDRITPTNFDRPNLHFDAIKIDPNQRGLTEAKYEALRAHLTERLPANLADNGHPLSLNDVFGDNPDSPMSGLVFTLFAVEQRFGVNKLQSEIRKALPGDLASRVERFASRQLEGSTFDKDANASRFLRDELGLLVCTKAFGMGVDKPTIAHTTHVGMPPSLEAFAQEAGRAGRDGRKSQCTIIFTPFPGRRDVIDTALRTPYVESDASPLQQALQTLRKREPFHDLVQPLLFHASSFGKPSLLAQQTRAGLEAAILNADMDDEGNWSTTLPSAWKSFAGACDKHADSDDGCDCPVDPDDKRMGARGAPVIFRMRQIGLATDVAFGIAGNPNDIGFHLTVNPHRPSPRDWEHLHDVTLERLISLDRSGTARFKEELGGWLERYEDCRGSSDLEKGAAELIQMIVDTTYKIIETGRRHAMHKMYTTLEDAFDGTVFNEERFRSALMAYLVDDDDFLTRLSDPRLLDPTRFRDFANVADRLLLERDDRGVGTLQRIVEDNPTSPTALTALHTAELEEGVIDPGRFLAQIEAVLDLTLENRYSEPQTEEILSWMRDRLGKSSREGAGSSIVASAILWADYVPNSPVVAETFTNAIHGDYGSEAQQAALAVVATSTLVRQIVPLEQPA